MLQSIHSIDAAASARYTHRVVLWHRPVGTAVAFHSDGISPSSALNHAWTLRQRTSRPAWNSGSRHFSQSNCTHDDRIVAQHGSLLICKFAFETRNHVDCTASRSAGGPLFLRQATPAPKMQHATLRLSLFASTLAYAWLHRSRTILPAHWPCGRDMASVATRQGKWETPPSLPTAPPASEARIGKLRILNCGTPNVEQRLCNVWC